MAEVRWRHDGRRLVLPIAVLPSQVADNAHQMEVVDALIDTGATGTGVRPDIAAKLHVRGRGRRLVSTANGDMLVPEFRLRLGFYPGFFDSQASASSATMPTILDFGVNAHALREGFAYALLIGMDILSKCDFSMDRSGSCSLAFG